MIVKLILFHASDRTCCGSEMEASESKAGCKIAIRWSISKFGRAVTTLRSIMANLPWFDVRLVSIATRSTSRRGGEDQYCRPDRQSGSIRWHLCAQRLGH